MTKEECNNEIEMLKGNINRMCVTDNIKELESMFIFAGMRLVVIKDYNKKRIG